jgi:hypothetical protein
MTSFNTLSLVKITTGLLLGCAAFGLFMTPARAHTADGTTDVATTIAALLKQIAELQGKVKTSGSTSGTAVQAGPAYTYTVTDDGKSGRSKITLTAPEAKAEFDKEDDSDPIVVSWNAKNIPGNSLVEVELDTLKLETGGVGGGIWADEIPEGDSAGVYNWVIHGEGRASAGTYRVRTIVRACHSEGCDVNPRFPGKEERIKTYAKSAWRTITITDDNSPETASYKAVLNGRTVDSERDVTSNEAEELCSVVYNDYETHDFEYGDVLKCYWDGHRFETVDQWKG